MRAHKHTTLREGQKKICRFGLSIGQERDWDVVLHSPLPFRILQLDVHVLEQLVVQSVSAIELQIAIVLSCTYEEELIRPVERRDLHRHV